MTPAQLAQAITDRATQIKVRSTSAAVDGWATEIQAYAKQIPTLAPTINERRKPGERRKKDKAGSLMRRVGGRRGGVSATLPPVVAVIETITVTSSAPVNFEPPNTHPITIELKDRNGAVYDDRTVTYTSSDTNLATVSAVGVVTAVAPGSPVITIKAEGLTVTVAYVVTTPQNVANNILLSASTMNVTVNTVAPSPSATVRDVSNQTLTGQTVTWSEVSGAGDVTLSADSATDAHTTQVTGITAGTRVIRATSGALTADITVTVDAVPVGSGVTDPLGINHPNLPAGYSPILARICGSTKSSGGTFSLSAYPPYGVGYTERFDDMQEGMALVSAEPTVPFQTERALLYPGFGTRCLVMQLNPGSLGNQSFGRMGAWQTTSPNHPNSGPTSYASLGLNQLWRTLYQDSVFRFLPDFPSQLLNKMCGFVGVGPEDNALMLQLANANNNSMTSPLGPLRWNLQSSYDSSLAADVGDRSGQINAQWGTGAANPGVGTVGTSLTSQIPGFASVTFTRGVWYRIERLIHLNTYGSTDGWGKFWLSSWSGSAWSTPVLVGHWTGLNLLHFNTPGQTYFRSIQPYMQNQSNFVGTGRFTPYNNFDVISAIATPYQIGTTSYTLATNTVCDLGTSATIPAALYGVAKISADASGVLTATWSTNGGAGYTSVLLARNAMGWAAPASQAEVGFIVVQAGASTWTSGTDALAGQTGGTPAATTSYSNRSGVQVALEYWAMSTS